MSHYPPLLPGHYYHIYHRGHNQENIFREKRNYLFFLHKYAHYIEPVVHTYAYCLLPNHFHVAIRVRTKPEQNLWFQTHPRIPGKSSFTWHKPPQQFSNFFNSYTRAFNKTYARTGCLFEGRFRRRRVTSLSQLITLILYLHRNPQHHNVVDDFQTWPYSSYHAIMSKKPTHIARNDILFWFGSRNQFVQAHQQQLDLSHIAPLISDD